ncbi:TetR/AcrR family transcriptional regulator [Nocardia tengchongensis]|uniref:TetR/AcrR family transcriptional regulator n=1 Tax=Nocardia tengchongensis TaxID=2055889 RepID=A0ABX8CP18_9NOCA|nr:TetR/AcrR family transcriptional regulator [Nocardia tengchongensis]QVI21701.1 TetR/AcrR family transcriptional regulator [Nocardia tengchongensis]
MGRPRNFDADTVVDRAMDAFWTHGYANTSPAQLAEATGVGKGSLYNTFGSKRELFDLCMTRYDRMGTDLANEVLSQPGTAKERLRAWMRLVVDSDLARPVRRGCLVANTAMELGGHDPAATTAVTVAVEHMIEAFTARIQQGQRDGDVRADVDARAYSEFLMNTVGGLRITTKVSDAETLYRIIDTALSTL